MFKKLSDMERDYILEVLAANNENYRATAEALGIGRSTLQRKLNGYDFKRGARSKLEEKKLPADFLWLPEGEKK